MELGEDGRTIVALLPALEVADTPDLSWDVPRILAGQHLPPRRGVRAARGGRLARGRAGVVNGEEREQVPAERTGGPPRGDGRGGGRPPGGGRRAPAPGERIITGVLAPPPAVAAGDSVRLELESLGAVELAFSYGAARPATPPAHRRRCAPSGISGTQPVSARRSSADPRMSITSWGRTRAGSTSYRTSKRARRPQHLDDLPHAHRAPAADVVRALRGRPARPA